MTKIFIAITCLLLVLILVLVFVIKAEFGEQKKLQEYLAQEKEYAKRLENRVNLLEGELRIKSENRKEANEKIDNLHSGDTLGNALDALHTH